MSIKRKLMLAFILASTLPVVLSCGALMWQEYRSERAALLAEAATLAQTAVSNTRQALARQDRAAAEHVLAEIQWVPRTLSACLYDSGGRLFAFYRRSPDGVACPAGPPAVREEFTRERLVLVRSGSLGTVSIYTDSDPVYEHVGEYLQMVPFVLLASLLLSSLLNVKLRRMIADPILRLAGVARAVSEKQDYSARAPVGGSDEVGTLTAAFNGMLEQIGEHARQLMEINRKLSAAKETAERTALALAESEARFRLTFEGAPVGMVVANPDSSVAEANPAFQRMLGYGAGELNGRPLGSLLHPDDVQAGLLLFGEVAARRRGRCQAEQRYLTKDGRTVWTRLGLSQLNQPGAKATVLLMAEDVSERKRLEEQFQQAQKMEAIGRLAGGIAHDFNNLLTVIKGNTDLVIERLASVSPLRKKLQDVLSASERAASLVKQLLAFSRKQLVNARVVDLNPLVQDFERMLRPLLRENIAVSIELGPRAIWVEADPVQMQQILLNLALNARDAMPQGGRLRIGTAVETAPENAEMRPGECAVLKVQDNGIGMSPEIQAHIFEPFFTTKEVGKGTGLGLASVYGIVRQAGGAIQVQSKPGGGSTFRVYLPLAGARGDGAGPESAPAGRTRGGGERILVVEDQEEVREILCETLTGSGYAILEGASGEEALRKAGECGELIQLLVTDMVMPGMSGRELAEKIRAQRPGIRVLFMSGYSEDTEGLAGAFLKKPFTPNDLVRTVRTLLEE